MKPMLLYILPLVGLTAFTAHEVSGISAVQVFFATISGVWAYRKRGLIKMQLILYMGVSILLGSFIGGFGSSHLSEGVINLIYGVLATIAAVMMFIPKKEQRKDGVITFNRVVASSLAFIVGLGAGIVWGSGCVYFSPNYASCLKNSDACYDCDFTRYYVCFFHWHDAWKSDNRPSVIWSSASYDKC